MQDNRLPQQLGNHLKTQVITLGGFLLAFWVLEIIDWLFFHGALNGLGVKPRTLVGLRGIFLAPFLHGNFAHLMANTVPFLVLGWFVIVQGIREFWIVTGVTAVISGLGIWLFGSSNSVHIGASGLIFGYFGYLLLRGYFERSLRAILCAIVVVILYGGMLWGVLPLRVGVSWQAHLFGFIGGGVAAYWLSQRHAMLKDQIIIHE
ncbi:MAG: rhomboid family intramembrane serine protease [Chloroflexota bacterium]